MKKQSYMAPCTVVLNIKLQEMIAASPVDVNRNEQDGISDESKLLGRQRGGSMWDDEE